MKLGPFSALNKKSRLLSWLPALLIVMVSLLALLKPYLHSGFPYTHDGENHLARFANYKLAVKQKQIPPRFAPNLMNRYGYPVLNYNYPLANILSLFFSVFKINYELTFKLLAAGSFAAGGVGLWLWLKQLRVESKLAKAVGISMFYLAPFVVNLVYVRGNIGEIMAVNLFIWLGVVVESLVKNRWSRLKFTAAAVIGCSFLLSHNIAAVFGMGLMAVYAAARLRQQPAKIKILGWWLAASIGLSLWFWLPALAEKHLITLDAVDITTNFAQHFPTLEQLLSSPLSFGFSYPTLVDTMSFALGKPQLLVLVLAAVLPIMMLVIAKRKIKQIDCLLLIGVWTLVLLQLQAAKPLWLLVPFASYIQFPWRLSLFAVVLIAVWWGRAAAKLNSQSWALWSVVILLGLQWVSVWKFAPADFFHKRIRDYDAFTQSTTTMNENLPKSFSYDNIADWQPTAIILDGSGVVEVSEWNGSMRRYQLHLTEDSIIVEPTMHFAGWQTKVNQQPVEYVDSEQIAGRIAYRLPAGQYRVVSKFTQRTWPRIVGNSLSVLTATWLAAAVISDFLLKYEQKNFG